MPFVWLCCCGGRGRILPTCAAVLRRLPRGSSVTTASGWHSQNNRQCWSRTRESPPILMSTGSELLSLKQRSVTDLTTDLWLARWHVDRISGPTTESETAGSVTAPLFVKQLLHPEVSGGQISNKGSAERAISEPTTLQKRRRQEQMWQGQSRAATVT